MNECQMCHSEDSTFNCFCKDCWIEMIREAKSAGQDDYDLGEWKDLYNKGLIENDE